MGQDKAHRQGCLKAASLLESVLALGLLAGLLSMTALMLFNVLATDTAGMRTQAWMATERALASVRSGTSWEDSAEGGDGLGVRVIVLARQNGHQHVRLVCERDNVVVLERECIVELP